MPEGGAADTRRTLRQQIGQVAASIREWGWTIPILVDESGGVIAGHARLLAAKKLGLPDVPVMVASGWSDAQKRAYVLADNKLALNAGWDEDLLRGELTDLRTLDFDIKCMLWFESCLVTGLVFKAIRGRDGFT